MATCWGVGSRGPDSARVWHGPCRAPPGLCSDSNSRVTLRSLSDCRDRVWIEEGVGLKVWG